jgi:CDP-diacylglycerol--serine O-phosphatidyltransferase
MLGFYNYTVVLTYIGMLAAFTGIMAACNGTERLAMVCLMAAGLCDMFDGAVARTRNRTAEERRFGIQIDSLSDLVSFGVLPGIILYCGSRNMAGALIASWYVLSALIRLAYFNVMEEERQEKTGRARSYYTGFPVTVSAAIIPAVYVLSRWTGGDGIWMEGVSLLVMSILFLLPFKVAKPHFTGKACFVLLGLAGVLVLSATAV